MDISRDNRASLGNLVVPVPITQIDEGDFTTYKKGDVAILKLNREDYKSVYLVKALLDALLRTNVVKGELEQLRDLVTEITGS